MLGKFEGKRWRGRLGMRWFDSIPDLMDMNLSKVQEIQEDKGVWCATVHGVTKSWTQFSDELQLKSEFYRRYHIIKEEILVVHSRFLPAFLMLWQTRNFFGLFSFIISLSFRKYPSFCLFVCFQVFLTFCFLNYLHAWVGRDWVTELNWTEPWAMQTSFLFGIIQKGQG